MFRKGGYNVEKAARKEAEKEKKMKEKKKAEIRYLNEKHSPSCSKKNVTKTIEPKRWVNNKAFK